jgi:uncharacterized protein YdeI (YjbR/CyaY-like superfamily)
MARERRHEEVVVPEDVDAALRADPQAAAIWDSLTGPCPPWDAGDEGGAP